MTTIPKGYQLHVTTWENDGDAYMTQIISGLTKEDTHFYIDLARQFKSVNNTAKEGKGLGNSEPELAVLVDTIKDCVDRHPSISESVRKDFTLELREEDDEDEDDEDAVWEMVMELVHRILGEAVDEYYGWRFCRVYSSHKVYYIPEGVQEVTKDFV